MFDLFLPLRPFSAALPLAVGASLTDHSIKSIWGIERHSFAREMKVARLLKDESNESVISASDAPTMPCTSPTCFLFLSLLQMDTPVQANTIGTYIGSPNHTTNYSQVRRSIVESGRESAVRFSLEIRIAH